MIFASVVGCPSQTPPQGNETSKQAAEAAHEPKGPLTGRSDPQPSAVASSAPSAAASAATSAMADPSGGGSFTVPTTKEGKDGWQLYVDSKVYDREACASLEPSLDSPEAATVRFLASKARGDDDFKASLATSLDARAKHKLADWKTWRVVEFKLLGKKPGGQGVWVKVEMTLDINGEKESGTDEFTVVQQGDGWRVLYPPT
jgi:hypothetical protein